MRGAFSPMLCAYRSPQTRHDAFDHNSSQASANLRSSAWHRAVASRRACRIPYADPRHGTGRTWPATAPSTRRRPHRGRRTRTRRDPAGSQTERTDRAGSGARQPGHRSLGDFPSRSHVAHDFPASLGQRRRVSGAQVERSARAAAARSRPARASAANRIRSSTGTRKTAPALRNTQPGRPGTQSVLSRRHHSSSGRRCGQAKVMAAQRRDRCRRLPGCGWIHALR